MARMPGQKMPRAQMAAMMEKKKAAGQMPQMPATHVANMMGGPIFGHLGRFGQLDILKAGHNTVPNSKARAAGRKG